MSSVPTNPTPPDEPGPDRAPVVEVHADPAATKDLPARPKPGVAPRRTALPPQPHDRVRLWTSLLISVLVCMPALLVGLNEPDVVPGPEATTLQMSRETWRRQQSGDPLAWIVPSLNGEPQVDRPPGIVWANMLMWHDLDESTVSADTLALRARWASVLMGVLALLATYWAGASVGDVRTARIATMALGTTWLFIDQVRIATAYTHVMGWTTLAIAAGLWAMRPLKDVAWVGRRVLGWLISGLAMGAAVLCGGAVPGIVFVLPPLVAAILLTPRRRIDNALGLVFAVILGLIVAAPWYLYVLSHMPDAAKIWMTDLDWGKDLLVLSWSHLWILPMLWPWPVWLVGALCQPFIRADSARRRQLLIAWFWFVLMFAALSIPAARNTRYLLPVIPAAALMVGQLWSYHAALAAERQEDPGVDLLRVPHWLMMGVASVAGPLWLMLQPTMVSWGYMKRVEVPGVNWMVALGLGLGLLVIAILGTQWHFKWRPRAAAYATVGWMVAASTVGFWFFSHAAGQQYPARADSERLAHATAELSRSWGWPNDAELFVLADRDDHPDADIDPAMLFYAGRSERRVTPDQLDELLQANRRALLVTTDEASDRDLLAHHGFKPFLHFTDGSTPRVLYKPME